MASELRPSFPVLEDVSTQAGSPWHMGKAGDASGTRNAAPALVAIDASGDLQYLKVNVNGELIVADPDSDFACLDAEGTLDDGSATLEVLAEITLQASTTYRDVEVVVSCFRDAKYVVELIDDEGVTDVITTLFQGRVGSGHLTSCCRLECLNFASGAVGVVKLRIRAQNINALSDIDGAISVKEEQTV